MEHVTNDQISILIDREYKKKIGKSKINEFRSWDNSMLFMYKALNTQNIPEDCGVAIEYKIPATSKRVDFILTGLDNDDKENIIIVELKQWSELEEVTYEDAIVKIIINKSRIKVSHPSYQAWSYASLIEEYNDSVEKNKIKLHPCAYLHNYIKSEKNDPLNSSVYTNWIKKAPAYTKGDVSKLREFIMIDDQKVAFESVLRTVRDSIKNKTKKAIIIEGGPGTGKSVLAINLLVKICNMNLNCQYVTKNSAPRYVYCEKLKGNYTQKYINNLFKGSGSYIETKNNEIDVLVVDEAHRLNKKSGMFKNLGENQIKEIINTAKISIFFVDDNQKVTLDDVLGIGETGNFDGFDFDYDFEVFNSPSELKKAIESKNNLNNKSRLVAGYCYEWISKGKGKGNWNKYDIEFPEYNFKIKWNLSNSNTWAIDKNSVNECGCIHTCQGLEFDYVGVIIGKDLRYKDGMIITDFNKRAKTDRSLWGIKKLYKENKENAIQKSNEIIKNTYRILMTRGIKGCYIWCEDKELNNYFKIRKKILENQISVKEIEENFSMR